MKKIVIKDFVLPVFPGFYNTYLDPTGHIDRLLEENGIDPNTKMLKFEEWSLDIAEGLCQCVEKELKERFGVRIKLQNPKVISPRYYNYENDRIYATLITTKHALRKLRKTAFENPMFRSWIKRAFKGRDGFIPHYSSDIKDWGKYIINDLIEDDFLITILMTFLLEKDIDECFMEVIVEKTDIYKHTTDSLI